jgi:hypothetical protein
MSRQELFKISLRAVSYDGSGRVLNCLTFVFENYFAPPLGTYDKNPSKVAELDPTKRIGSVEFGLSNSNFGRDFALCGI